MTAGSVPPLSFAVLAVIVLGMLIASVVRYWHVATGRGGAGTKSFFLMDSSAGPGLLIMTYVATLLSAFTFVGLPGFFYSHGIGTWLFVPFANVAAVLIFFYFGRTFRKMRIQYDAHSPIEILGKAYNSRTVARLAFVTTVVFILPHLAVQISGIGKLATGLGIDYVAATSGLLALFVLYTVTAGMWGDVWTDVIQAVVMFAGLAIVAAIMLQHWPSLSAMFDAVRSRRGDQLLSLPGPQGFFTKVSLISYAIMFMSVNIVQAPYVMRVLISRDDTALRRACMYIPWVLILFFIPTLIIGMGGAALYPNLASGDHVIGTILRGMLTSHVAGALLLGVILGAMVCAVVSTVDSQLLAIGATFARDIYVGEINPHASQRAELFVARVVMVVIAVLGFIIALNPPRLIVQLSIVSVAGTLQMLPAFIGAVVSKRPHAVSAVASIVVGLTTFAIFQWYLSSRTLGPIPAGIAGLAAGTLALFATQMVVSAVHRSMLSSSSKSR